MIADLPDFFERAFATVAAAVEASVGAFFTRVVGVMPGLPTVELVEQTRWPSKVETPDKPIWATHRDQYLTAPDGEPCAANTHPEMAT